ncbi:MAG: hypothetical protein HYR91_12185 [Flavobacteriia bacterium]|nr:hypothetical protein [Flavobacteriia bacterium]
MLFKNLYIGKNEVVLFDNDTLKRKIHGVNDAIYFQLYYHDMNQKKFIQKKIDKNLYLRIAKIKIK